MICHFDYETRSDIDLRVVGAHAYARHSSTRILCCAYSIDGAPVQGWPKAAGHRMPDDLGTALLNPKCEMHAWNAQFERLITKHVLDIDIPLDRWHCTAALARARGMPGKLEDALDYIGAKQSLHEKRRGSQIMLKWCKPLPAPGGGYADDPNEYMELLMYCMHDVMSEMLVASKLVPLFKHERADYALTERINDAGLPIDLALARAAMEYGAQEKQELNESLRQHTNGRITSTSQHKRIKECLREALNDDDVFKQFFTRMARKKLPDGTTVEVEKESTDKAARADFLRSEAAKDCAPEIIDLIELVDDAGKASVAKYARMAGRAADTGRAQGAYICYGAIQTKRFSSTGIQVHNFPRETPKNVQAAVDAVMQGTLAGKVMHVLASLLRPTIMAADGRTLIWGDWTAVEAKGMPWLADCQWKLNLYRDGIDVYKVNAVNIFDVEYDDVTDEQRQIGKVAELSLQFGGARGALRSMARGYGISLDNATADNVVYAWRAANPWAMQFSKGLYGAFMQTVLGTDTKLGHVSYRQIRPLLPGTVSIACDLPGDTTLYYHGIKGTVVEKGRPPIEVTQDLDGWSGRPIDQWETEVVFQKALPNGFRTERIWHGLLAENVTQALCAGLLRDCTRRTDKVLRYHNVDAQVIGHTHDEIVLEAGDIHAAQASRVLRREMVRVTEWLDGFPLGAEIKTGQRYVK
jgi:DNA polymerase